MIYVGFPEAFPTACMTEMRRNQPSIVHSSDAYFVNKKRKNREDAPQAVWPPQWFGRTRPAPWRGAIVPSSRLRLRGSI